ncbi:RusA family crossover junction endodeoxyribonuclease [Tepidanaerobacter syntrophicus]|uniref:RusA family crossover junction endodeoxyribonuclease n=1 Tax=Tepidanaerobacter syntrophicus TaxID=224999 RepID=UPI001BD2D017|nr:RusA family crossover junction endodeoxyribonuclease [Tepidanaerobacter syntrophicus]
MKAKIIIPGEMPGMNEIIEAAKRHHMQYAEMKKENTRAVAWVSKRIPKKKRVFLNITWYCKNKKKDPDNIAAAVKFIWDGLVEAGVVENDGWEQNAGWANHFEIDKENPRVEIELEEIA